jgi:protocatechuate 3,4-dioxygenase beta subunit
MRYALPFLFVTAFISAPVAPVQAQDREFIRAIERATAERPARLEAAGRIAPQDEPGTPLVIHGQVFAEDGRTPAVGAVIFAYHTDRSGLYDRAGSPPHSWRLRGWVRADSNGRFEFRTIRPGSYPGERVPAHVHFTAFTGERRYHAGELRFEDDRLVTDHERAESTRDGEFGHVRPVRREQGTEHVDFRIRLAPRDRFD